MNPLGIPPPHPKVLLLNSKTQSLPMKTSWEWWRDVPNYRSLGKDTTQSSSFSHFILLPDNLKVDFLFSSYFHTQIILLQIRFFFLIKEKCLFLWKNCQYLSRGKKKTQSYFYIEDNIYVNPWLLFAFKLHYWASLTFFFLHETLWLQLLIFCYFDDSLYKSG